MYHERSANEPTGFLHWFGLDKKIETVEDPITGKMEKQVGIDIS
jgi:hypothetical protein